MQLARDRERGEVVRVAQDRVDVVGRRTARRDRRSAPDLVEHDHGEERCRRQGVEAAERDAGPPAPVQRQVEEAEPSRPEAADEEVEVGRDRRADGRPAPAVLCCGGDGEEDERVGEGLGLGVEEQPLAAHQVGAQEAEGGERGEAVEQAAAAGCAEYARR